MQPHDLAVGTLPFKILSGRYLGNNKVQLVLGRHINVGLVM